MRASTIVITLFGAGLVALGYAAFVERNWFRLRIIDVPVLPAGSAPLRVLHLSDLHVRPQQRRKLAFLHSLRDQQPDVVVSTGDLLADRHSVPAVLAAFEPLRDVPAVFVFGSNDYFAPRPKNPFKYFFPDHRRVIGDALPWRELAAGLTELGWADLTNTRTELTAGGRRIALAGVDDPHLKRDDPSIPAAPADASADLQVGVVHAPEPRVLTPYAKSGYRLLLAGHTHGGQLRLPGFGALVTNCGIDRARARGLSRYDGAWLHVSPGLGTSPYAPVRFACRPEVTLLRLVPVE